MSLEYLGHLRTMVTAGATALSEMEWHYGWMALYGHAIHHHKEYDVVLPHAPSITTRNLCGSPLVGLKFKVVKIYSLCLDMPLLN